MSSVTCHVSRVIFFYKVVKLIGRGSQRGLPHLIKPLLCHRMRSSLRYQDFKTLLEKDCQADQEKYIFFKTLKVGLDMKILTNYSF